jgi:hypothetical protein
MSFIFQYTERSTKLLITDPFIVARHYMGQGMSECKFAVQWLALQNAGRRLRIVRRKQSEMKDN